MLSTSEILTSNCCPNHLSPNHWKTRCWINIRWTLRWSRMQAHKVWVSRISWLRMRTLRPMITWFYTSTCTQSSNLWSRKISNFSMSILTSRFFIFWTTLWKIKATKKMSMPWTKEFHRLRIDSWVISKRWTPILRQKMTRIIILFYRNWKLKCRSRLTRKSKIWIKSCHWMIRIRLRANLCVKYRTSLLKCKCSRLARKATERLCN